MIDVIFTLPNSEFTDHTVFQRGVTRLRADFLDIRYTFAFV